MTTLPQAVFLCTGSFGTMYDKNSRFSTPSSHLASGVIQTAVSSGEIRRPHSSHASCVPSPGKQGVGKTLVKQVAEVIG